MKLYLAGPMSGVPEFNRPTFMKVAEFLRLSGHDVISPAELDDEDTLRADYDYFGGHGVTDRQRAKFLKRDLKKLLKCDALALLPGWQTSSGANTELVVAYAVGIPAYEVRGVDGDNPMLDLNGDLVYPLWQRVMSHVERTGKQVWMKTSDSRDPRVEGAW